MMRSPRGWILFLIAATVTLLCWSSLWQDGYRETGPVAGPPATTTAEPVWSQEQIDTRLAAVADASTDTERLAASNELLRIPSATVPELVERIKSGIERDFSPQARVLLIRWASADGEAAANWAWKSFRSGHRWKGVFNEIGATWATHNPVGFMRWAVEAAKRSPDPWSGGIPLKEAESSEFPLLDSDQMGSISQWLVTESAYLAHKFILETDAKVYPRELLRTMDSVQDVRDALLACEESAGAEGPTDGRGGASMRKALLLQWFVLDPENFNLSPHAEDLTIASWQAAEMLREQWEIWPETDRVGKVSGVLAKVHPTSRGDFIGRVATEWAKTDSVATARWLESLPPEDSVSANTARVISLAARDLTGTLDWAERLPPEEWRSSLTDAFDAWTLAHPGQRADREGWSAARVRAWEDLEALLPAGGR